MQCDKGGETVSSQHIVKTQAKAEEWARVPVRESDLPVTVYQDKAPSGRIHVLVVSVNDEVLADWG